MNKSLSRALSQYFSRGVDTGAMTMSLALLISMENVLPEYIPEGQLSEVFNRMEDDLEDVWKEVTHDGKKYADDMAELLIGHAQEIRKKRGMEVL